ncbi:leucine-rich repeat domain-containing protein [Alphaproteobacteria bacterium]|nr:leucine-rich repeat domain-containing protein [Alphaproteobacteria bacterium]
MIAKYSKMTGSFLFLKRAAALSVVLMSFSSFSVTFSPDQESSPSSVRGLKRFFENHSSSDFFPAAEAAPIPPLLEECRREIAAGKAQKAMTQAQTKREEPPFISEEDQKFLLFGTVLHPDIAPLISGFLEEKDLAAMRGTCRWAYHNRGTLTLNHTPRQDRSRDSQALLRFLYHNRLARGLDLRTSHLPSLGERMNNAGMSFSEIRTVSLKGIGFTPAMVTPLRILFPNIEILDLSDYGSAETSQGTSPNKMHTLPASLQDLPLKNLALRHARVDSIAGIVGMPLTSLDLSGTHLPPDEYASLSHIPTLETLRASWDYAKDPDVQYRLIASQIGGALPNLLLLKHLDLNWHYLEDLDPAALSGLIHLRHLDLGRTEIPTVVFAQNLTQLTHVVLRENKIEAIEALRGATGIVSLDLAQNDISTLDVLKGMRGLRVLDLSFNKRLTSITSLESLTDMEDLRLTGNKKITTVAPLHAMRKLEHLNLDTTGVSSLLPLVGMKDLRHLNISDCKVSDIGPLSRLKNLQVLYMGRNPLDTENPVYNLKNLMTLHLTGIPMKHPEKLSRLPYLFELCLSKTGAPLHTVASLTFLNFLNLDQSDLTDPDLDALDLTNIRNLSLRNNPHLSEERLRSLKRRFPRTYIAH